MTQTRDFLVILPPRSAGTEKVAAVAFGIIPQMQIDTSSVDGVVLFQLRNNDGLKLPNIKCPSCKVKHRV
jgi:hypothetical protein